MPLCPNCQRERDAKQREAEQRQREREAEQRQREREAEQRQREREAEQRQRCDASQQRADAICIAGAPGGLGKFFDGGEALSHGLACLTQQKLTDQVCKK